MKIIYLDTCQPDYFQGFSGKTLIAFHNKNQTVREALESLKSNAQNEYHDSIVYEAIDRMFVDHYSKLDNTMIDEKFCEFDENEDSGLIHYFGIIED